ncbi:MAG: leucine-rich repeat protein [Bacteroidales bacterium]|nr:leucine-rich repeat protein [Bacteroidales bacterium]
MKRTLLFALSLLAVVACSKFDDSAIWDQLNKHEDRIVKLETLCNQMNTNITSLQTIIIALQSNDYVVNIAPIKEGNKEIGYTITFAKSGSITIYHGQDGKNGKDGANGKDGVNGKDGADGKDGQNGKDGVNGKDGQDGYTPKIGVRQHTDGKYYWTLDGNWLLDDSGNMIPTTGEDGKDGANGADGADGKDGQNGKDGEDGKNGQDGSDGKDGVDGVNGTDGKDGKDGITPQLKIEDGFWYLSYDNGVSWQKLGKATGKDGLNGADGDSIIDSITQDDENVYFILSDGQMVTIQKSTEKIIIFSDINVKIICLEHWDLNEDCEISQTEAASVTSIGNVFYDNDEIIMFNELKYFTGLKEIPSNAFKSCDKLTFVTLPNGLSLIGSYAFSDCTNLKRITIPASVVSIQKGAFYRSKNLKSVSFEKGSLLTSIPGGSYDEGVFAYCESLEAIEIPNNVVVIGGCAFRNCKKLKELTFQSNSKCSILDYTMTVSGEWGAFVECSSLEEIVLPASLTEIKQTTFANCTSLKRVSFESGSNLISIRGGGYGTSSSDYKGAFKGCTSLEEFDASNCTNLYTIEAYVFNEDDSPNTAIKIKTFKIGSTNPPTSGGISIVDLYVPKGYKDAYLQKTPWKNATNIFELE